MRLTMPAHRLARAAALALMLAVTAAACSSSSSPSAPTSPSTAPASSAASSAASSPGGAGTSPDSAAAAEIKANWAAFFSGKTSATQKIALLQNGQKYAAIIKAQAGSSLASGAGAKVTKVVVNSPTSATVSYDITLNGTTALPNQTGTAVNEGGTWKVGDVSFCQLLKLEGGGKAPSECSG